MNEFEPTSGRHLPIEQSEVFIDFEHCSETIWRVVASWKPFERDTIGKQLVRAIDSVGANLVEGDGRFSVADGLHFFVIARASAREALLWLKRGTKRGLIPQELGHDLTLKLESAMRQLNGLIQYRRSTGKFTKEEAASYDYQPTP